MVITAKDRHPENFYLGKMSIELGYDIKNCHFSIPPQAVHLADCMYVITPQMHLSLT